MTDEKNDSAPMRADDYANAVTGLGGPPDKGQYTFFQRQPELTPEELFDWYEQDALAARVIDRLPDDATREGFVLKGKDESFDWNGLQSELEDLDVLNVVADAWRWGRLMGGGLIVLAVNDGRKFDEPIDMKGLRKVSGLQVVESTFAQPEEYTAGLGSRSFRMPKYYTVTVEHGSGKARRIHRDRVIRIDGVKVPPSQMIRRGGWGPSVLQRIATQLRQLGEVMGYSRSIAHNISVPVMQLEGLKTMLKGDTKTQRQVQQIFENIRMTMDNLHVLALDANDKVGEAKRDVSGLEKLIEKFVDAIVRATDMPRTILLGEQPSGLGASADSEIRSWYDHVHAQQRLVLTPVINRILELSLQVKSRHETVPSEWTVEYNPLWQPNDTEKAQARLTNAQADQIYYTIGGMSVPEIRQRLESEGTIEDADEPVPPPAVDVLTGSPPGGSGALATADEEGDNLVGLPSDEPVPDDLVDVREAARIFGIPTRTLTRMMEKGDLSYWQFGLRRQVSVAEVAMAGRVTSKPGRVQEHEHGAEQLDDRIDRAGDDEDIAKGLGQPFPEARADRLAAKYGRMNEIALRAAKRKVIPAIISGSDGAVADATEEVQAEVERRFTDDTVEGLADEEAQDLKDDHASIFFAALSLAVGSTIVGSDDDTDGIPRGEPLPPPGVPGPDGVPVSRARIGVRVNPQPQLFASEFTAENVALIGELRSGIKAGLDDAIVRAQALGGTPEETAERLLRQWERNGVPSQIPIDRVKKNGERVLVSTEKHARLVAHDQLNKLNARLNQTRQEAAGITEFVWTTRGDDRVREEHAAIDGNRYTWAAGHPTEGLPGEPVNCRCSATPVVNDEQVLLSGDFVSLD